MVEEVVWAYPVEREAERVRVEDVEIREARVATEVAPEALVEWEDPVVGGVCFATFEYSNTVPPSCCIQVVGIPSSETEKSHSDLGRGQESSR
jgi:hypothetical protein